MDRQRMESCLQQVVAYRASGQKGRVWAEANGVPPRALALVRACPALAGAA